MKKVFISFCIIICSTTLVHSQYTFDGVVLDTIHNTILPYAEIHLFPPDSVIYSDSSGFFKLPIENMDDSLSITVKYIGYYDCIIPLTKHDDSHRIDVYMIPRIPHVDTLIHPIQTIKHGLKK